MPLNRRPQRQIDYWPGFVDALGNLLIIMIFVLLVFVLAQFFLGRTLSTKEEALGRMAQQVSELTNLLKIERKSNESLQTDIARLADQLASANAQVESLAAEKAKFGENAGKMAEDIAALRALKEQLEREITARDKLLDDGKGKLDEQVRLTEQERAQAALLRQQLEAVRQEMARLAQALDAAETVNKQQQAQISDLGKQLNRALATKVQELQRYRSEFFGRLREVLGNRQDIRIEGDRFVFQSEVLFASGSADLQPQGKEQLARLADTLTSIAKTIPPEVNWILRIDGHTDQLPIRGGRFATNWELSSARAISVVNFLIERGIPPFRLAAAGFGEFQPLADGSSPEVMAKNRRIELKLDQR